MRVLFTSTNGLGHVHPMVPLARAFAERGDNVLWATGRSACERLDRAGLATAPAGLDEADTMARFARFHAGLGDLPAAQRPDEIFPWLFGETLPGPMLSDLLPIARAFEPDLVVSESGEFAGPLLATLRGIPGVTHALGPLVPEARIAAAAGRLEGLWRAHGQAPLPYGGRYEHCYLDLYPASLQSQHRPHVRRTQPIRPRAYATPSDDPLPSGLDGSDLPLVYVTFGTAYNSPGALASVVRAVASRPVRVIATVGPSTDPGALGAMPGNVQAVGYLPQTELLPRCAAVVSHGGSGTFLGALGAGVPQLLVPQGADQFLNASACRSSGVGLALEPSAATPEAVADAVTDLLAEPRFGGAARRLQTEIEAMPSADEVAELLASGLG